MKKYFITGLALILPLTVTILVLMFLLDILTEPFVDIVKALFLHFKSFLGPMSKHPKVLLFVGRVCVLVLMIVSIFLLGFLARRFFFSWIHTTVTKILERIPFVRRIYRVTREITKSVLAGKNKPFSNPVMIPFPDGHSVAMGFKTGEAPAVCGSDLKSVFIPTAPHPISGFVIISRDKDIIPLDISAEDVLKFLVSCGTVHPGEKHDSGSSDPRQIKP
ncbi:MAG: DUF502 domain-containing protein [Chlamydiia bacterium]|nr:DUF502 domain-containing protein [Chlamydiia bacterium]